VQPFFFSTKKGIYRTTPKVDQRSIYSDVSERVNLFKLFFLQLFDHKSRVAGWVSGVKFPRLDLFDKNPIGLLLAMVSNKKKQLLIWLEEQ
jgi:hypothetical protein